MLIRTLALAALIAIPAHAAGPGWQYAVGTGPTPCASLQAANAAYATSLGTDATTPYWFDMIVLTNGTCAIKIVPGDPYYAASVTLPPSAKFPSGVSLSLTAANLPALNVALVSRASLVGLLPDVMTLASFEAILTGAQLTALNNVTQAAHPAIYNDWQAIKAGATVDMQDSTYQDLVAKAFGLGVITATQAVRLVTPVVTAAGP